MNANIKRMIPILLTLKNVCCIFISYNLVIRQVFNGLKITNGAMVGALRIRRDVNI